MKNWRDKIDWLMDRKIVPWQIDLGDWRRTAVGGSIAGNACPLNIGDIGHIRRLREWPISDNIKSNDAPVTGWKIA